MSLSHQCRAASPAMTLPSAVRMLLMQRPCTIRARRSDRGWHHTIGRRCGDDGGCEPDPDPEGDGDGVTVAVAVGAAVAAAAADAGAGAVRNPLAVVDADLIS